MKIRTPILELLQAHTEAHFMTNEKSFLQILIVKQPVTEKNVCDSFWNRFIWEIIKSQGYTHTRVNLKFQMESATRSYNYLSQNKTILIARVQISSFIEILLRHMTEKLITEFQFLTRRSWQLSPL